MLRSVRRVDPPKAGEPGAAAALALQAKDVAAARRALDDATGLARGLWFSFISFGAYLAIAAGSVTHRDLFLENPVKLPLLNVDLPLIAFFWIAPILLLVFHSYLLLNLKLLGDNVRAWESLVAASLSEVADRKEREAVTDSLRMQLPNFVVVQMLAAPRTNRGGVVGFALLVAVAGTIVIGPVVLICEMLVQFLPYHSEPVTALHRVALATDIILIWYFWRGVVGAHHWTLRWPMWVSGVLVSALLMTLANLFATFPGEDQHHGIVVQTTDAALIGIVCGVASHFDAFKAEETRCNAKDRDMRPLTFSQFLFEGPVNRVTGHRESLFSNSIVVPNQDFDPETEKDLAEMQVTRSFRGRHLEGAVLSRADLRKADFTGAKLDGAELIRARLNGAIFECATAGGKDDCVELQGASLNVAQMQGVSLSGAHLEGASLNFTSLQGAMLDGALLQGAQLNFTRLLGASLRRVDLQGATLKNAELQGAFLGTADLKGASLRDAQLQGAWLYAAQLKGASLVNARVWRIRERPGGVESVLAGEIDFHACCPPNRDGGGFDSRAYSGLVNSALEGAADEKTRDLIRQRLSVLDPDKPDPLRGMSPEEAEKFWKDIQSGYSAANHAAFIKDFACHNDAPPYVTQGLIRSVVRGVEGQTESIATYILDGLEIGTCPGAVGIDDEAMVQLHAWAPNWELKADRDKAVAPAVSP